MIFIQCSQVLVFKQNKEFPPHYAVFYGINKRTLNDESLLVKIITKALKLDKQIKMIMCMVLQENYDYKLDFCFTCN